MPYTIIRDRVSTHVEPVEYDGRHHHGHPAYARSIAAWRDRGTDALVLHVEYRATPDGEYEGGSYAEVYDQHGDLISETLLDGMACDPVSALIQTYEYGLEDCEDLSIEPAATLHSAGYLEGVQPPRGWWADDGSGAVHYADAETSEAAAREYVDHGDWTHLESTMWHTIWTWPAGQARDGDQTEQHRVARHPREPECSCGPHVWCAPHEVVGGLAENPGIQGHGGGVVIREVCQHCGVYRITDTWAQDPATGEQGLESIRYEEADEASEAWVASLLPDED